MAICTLGIVPVVGLLVGRSMSEHSSLPRLSIATLGGTVSMRLAVGDGVTPSLDCEQQLLQVPQLREMAQLNVASLCLLPSASLGFATLLEVLAWARARWSAVPRL
jgi:L-asparaginase